MDKKTEINFGQFVRQKRLSTELGLREFCRTIGVDASNWSKVENGICNPPDREVLSAIEVLLKLNQCEILKLRILAALDFIPKDYGMQDILNALPVLLPAKHKTDYEKILKLVNESFKP